MCGEQEILQKKRRKLRSWPVKASGPPDADNFISIKVLSAETWLNRQDSINSSCDSQTAFFGCHKTMSIDSLSGVKRLPPLRISIRFSIHILEGGGGGGGMEMEDGGF